jgi:hypothetical protein
MCIKSSHLLKLFNKEDKLVERNCVRVDTTILGFATFHIYAIIHHGVILLKIIKNFKYLLAQYSPFQTCETVIYVLSSLVQVILCM